jgi:hypothetical protein
VVQIAPVHQPPRHHSIERRHDLRIGEEGLDPLHRSGSQSDLGDGKGAVRFSNAHIGLGDVRVGARLVKRLVSDIACLE